MDKIKLIIELINKLYHDKFYGEIVIKLEAGVPTIAKKTETIKFSPVIDEGFVRRR